MKMSALRSRLDPNHKLGLCMQALQLALVSMSVALGGEAVRRLPFAYHRASVEEQVYTPPSYTLSYTPLPHIPSLIHPSLIGGEQAYDVVMEYEFGRQTRVELALGEVSGLLIQSLDEVSGCQVIDPHITSLSALGTRPPGAPIVS
jgi:hypothetical protein